jgi:DNA recombination protein RmuC
MASAQLSLQKETAQLVKALRQPSGRGRWGELQLQRVVELSGMQNYCDFYTPTEAEQSGADGLQRPNLVVNLPGNRIIAVDAHASLEAYLAAVESTDEETHQREMQRHAALVSRHLDALTTPRYAAQFNAKPEFTVLFLPGEGFLTAALGEEPDLLERGIERGIILATPSTLIALLRSAAVGWRQEGIAEKARTVSAAGRELYGHVNQLAKHIVKIGRSLDGTVRDYNAALGTLEQGVLPSTRKLSNLGIPAHPSKLPAVSRARVREEVLTPSTDEESESVNAPE